MGEGEVVDIRVQCPPELVVRLMCVVVPSF